MKDILKGRAVGILVDDGSDAAAVKALRKAAQSAGAQAILKAAGITKDAGVVDASDRAGFIKAAKTRQWAREPKLRTLA